MRLNIIFMMTTTPSLLRRLLPALILATALQAQEKKEGPIQDNSFLVEEAYNQEAGVVQHINTYTRDRDSKDWVYSFTQEWPVFSQKHQFSYTLPWQQLHTTPEAGQALGDAALNYRYQLLGDGDAPVAISPRFSLILPTGNDKRGYGRGSTGYQGMVPISYTMGSSFVGHTNVGGQYTPNASNQDGDKATLRDFQFGQSFIWLTHSRFNVMLEYVYYGLDRVTGPGQTRREGTAFLNPGIRWAYNFPSGLQIVPGLAFPIGVGPSKGQNGIYLYLSFEHPFTKTK
jgi:hypothetical protein